jgi:hypothetical protein
VRSAFPIGGKRLQGAAAQAQEGPLDLAGPRGRPSVERSTQKATGPFSAGPLDAEELLDLFDFALEIALTRWQKAIRYA